MAEDTYVDIQTLGRGAAMELFNDGLNKVLENILDPNTEAKQTRKVTLTVEFKPTEDRDVARAIMSVKCNLASAKGVGTFIFIGREQGRAVAMQRDTRQMDLPMTVTEGGNQ